jgi:Ca2+/H+ antiporter
VSASGKRVSAVSRQSALRQMGDRELQRIAFENPHDESTLWAVLDVVQHRPGKRAKALKRRLHERLILGRPLPAPLREAAIWRTAEPGPARRPWYAALAYVVIIAVVVAVARVAEADARLIDAVLDGVRSLGMYLTD